MTFTEVFGGTTIYPSGVSYRAVALSADQTLSWPVETATSGNVVAQIMDVTPSAGSLSIIMPPANEVSVGETTLFFNPGSFTFTVKDTGGNTIVAVPPGLSYQVYLIGNATPNGTWRSTQYAAGTSSATAGSLVGAGIKAISTTLNQSMSVTTLNSNYTIGDADRSEAFVWTGGAGALILPASGTVGNDWFCHVRNGGTGAITVTPTGSELINGAPNLTFNPGDSAIIICDGSSFFTIGFGQSAAFAFDYVSIDLSSPVTSPYTLSGANLNRIAYSFGGTLTTNMEVYIPATIQQYWISNNTSGAFSLTVKVAGQIGVVIPQGSRGIYYCNGTDIIDADTASFAFPLTVAQGGTGATTESGARINLGGTSVGIGVFTAVTAADGRNALLAAKSGANSDITSLSGLTTPLSVGQGGTGAATLTANGVVVGNGTSAVQVTAAGTTGQVLVGNTGGAPSWATLTGIGVTSFSGGTTGLTPASPTTGAITLAGTLGVANGGTGTTTAFTAGSVVFAGASGVYSQDNANLFWDDTNDRLGIGTATPANRLQVSYTSTAPSLSSDAGSGLSLLGSSTLRVNIGSDPSFPFGGWIQASNGSGSSFPLTLNPLGGNVGIGTASPSTVYRQTINGDGSSIVGGLSLRNNGTETLAIGNITAANDVDSEIWNPRNGFLRFATNNAERMRITSAGNVGIGTSAPSNRLHVYETASQTVARFESTLGSSFITLHTGSAQTFLGSDSTGAFLVQTPGSGYSTKMLVDASGNVGIGTASPSYVLNTNYNANATFTNAGSDFTQMWQNSGVNALGVALADDLTARFVANNGYAIAFNSAANEYMRITPAGPVLIGLTAAYQAAANATNLQIGDPLTTAGAGISLGATTTNDIAFADNTTGVGQYAGLIRYSHTSDFMALWTASTEQLRITSAGNVGIGATTPTEKLQIQVNTGTSGFESGFTLTNGVDANLFNYVTGTAATDKRALITVGAANQSLAFGTLYTERMRITSAGNVGIGTATPLSQLNVSFSPPASVPALGSGVGGLAIGPAASYGMLLGTISDGSGYIQQQRFDASSTVYPLLLQPNGGNVGIGTATSGAKLEVARTDSAAGIRVTVGQGAYSGNVALFGVTGQTNGYYITKDAVNNIEHIWDGTAGAERMRIRSDGNVGIGTNNPLLKLVVSNGGATGLEIDPTAVASAPIIQSYNRSGAAYTQLTYSALQHIWQISGTERMRITSAGDVGIGTNIPQRKLGIGGTANAYMNFNPTSYRQFTIGSDSNGFLIFDDVTAFYRMVIDTSGNVGFNVNAPSYPMEVRADGVSTASYIGITNTTATGGSGAAGYLARAGSNFAYFYVRGDGTAYIDNATANPLGFATNGSEKMRITSAGNVGIGTSSPSTRLHIEGSGAELRVQSTTAQEGFVRFINTSGSMSVGMSGSPANELLIYDRTNSQTAYIYAGGASGYHVWYTNNTERMRVDVDGNFMVGKSTMADTTVGFSVVGNTSSSQYGAVTSTLAASTSGNQTFQVYSTGASAYRFYVDMAGTVFATSTTISAISDIRLKENVRDLDAGLDTILALKPRRFDWKAGKGKDVRDDMGFIAQEVEEVLPALIGGWKAGEGEPDDLKSVKAGDLIPVLVKAIQELTARVAQLEGK